MIKNRILSGVQPTGNLHLGNYLGAIKNFVKFRKNNHTIAYAYYLYGTILELFLTENNKQIIK